MIFLDTQALVWWTTKPELLSRRAFKKIETEAGTGRISISSISILEVYLLIKKKKVRFTVDVDTWLETIEKSPDFEFIPVDNRIAAKSVTLPEPFHKDPADRIIVATARELGATLVTSDSKLRKYPHVKTLW
ncbi:type II toxin-antitoxin system VapC family toxin [Candidatus Curtissbacteria bacterium]|nr:type II toxin-antitoxin system VapC family toxin [Candidatus Curtissbacteria bacterium]